MEVGIPARRGTALDLVVPRTVAVSILARTVLSTPVEVLGFNVALRSRNDQN